MTATSLHFVPTGNARHLAPGSDATVRALRARGRAVWPLRRRGADLGYAVETVRTMPERAQAQRRWRDAEAVFLPGLLAARLGPAARHIRSCLAMFDRLRKGARFLDELDRRLAATQNFRYAGSTVDKTDAREVERVFVDAEQEGQVVAEDLWAKLAWIADDQTDRSLRIRFSHGLEQVEDWLQGGCAIAHWSDRFAAEAFPECEVIAGSQELHALLGQLIPRPYRLSERILYNNAPDGGAVFHHDAEPGQLGVAFNQLEGRTAWLAISKPRLALALVRHGRAKDVPAGMAALEREDDHALWQLLNRDPAFTGRLAAMGCLFVLEAGDTILLPSHGIDHATWHSVLALGEKPSLAHSYGIFPRTIA
ncbi:MAG: hypothetical protein RIT25_2552 [Planctomycetota bacterium]